MPDLSPSFERMKEHSRIEEDTTNFVGPLNQLGDDIWRVAEDLGWHKTDDTIYHYLSALGSEVGEAHNAFRDQGKGRKVVRNVIAYDRTTGEPVLQDPGKPEGIGPELADVIIRTAHLAYFLGIDLDREVSEKMEYNRTRKRHNEMRFDN